MRFWPLLGYMLLSSVPCCYGFASLDEDIELVREKWDGVGLTAWSVDGKGNMCSLGAAGERVKGNGSNSFVVTGDSRHHIGSITKSMTAVLLALLIHDGTIPCWDTKLSNLLSSAVGTAYENVTLRQLVSMQSGLPANPENWWLYENAVPGNMRAQRTLAAEDALVTTPENVPGTTFLYSNWGFVLAGHILEELTDTLWEDLLATRLFLPLGIDLGNDPTLFTGAPTSEDDPWGHFGDAQMSCDPATNSYKCDNPAVVGPAGTFSGPMAAMAQYFAWHVQCHNGRDDSTVLLPQKACRELHTPGNATVSLYGYGWECTQRDWAGGDGLTCTHAGSNTLNYYVVWLGFGLNRAFAAYTNGASRSNDEDALMVDEAVSMAIIGKANCSNRIPSSAYTN